MLFDPSDNLKDSAYVAFDGLFGDAGSDDHELTYVTTQLAFNSEEVRTRLTSLEKRARALVDNITSDESVGEKANAFEALSFYMQTTDVYDYGMEQDYIEVVIGGMEEMMDVFEAFAK